MFIADEPLLALIVRFVTDPEKSNQDNEEFIKRQIQALREHTNQYPEEEQGLRALEWIEQHARRYRRRWQRQRVSHDAPQLRCPDCPLRKLGAAEHCEIHEQWLYLLRPEFVIAEDHVTMQVETLRYGCPFITDQGRKFPGIIKLIGCLCNIFPYTVIDGRAW